MLNRGQRAHEIAFEGKAENVAMVCISCAQGGEVLQEQVGEEGRK